LLRSHLAVAGNNSRGSPWERFLYEPPFNACQGVVVTFMKGMIKVGRWPNEHKHAAAARADPFRDVLFG